MKLCWLLGHKIIFSCEPLMKLFLTVTFLVKILLWKMFYLRITVMLVSGAYYYMTVWESLWALKQGSIVSTAVFHSSRGDHSQLWTAATRSNREHVTWRQRWIKVDRQDLSALQQHDGKVGKNPHILVAVHICRQAVTGRFSFQYITIHSIFLRQKNFSSADLSDHNYNFSFQTAINDNK